MISDKIKNTKYKLAKIFQSTIAPRLEEIEKQRTKTLYSLILIECILFILASIGLFFLYNTIVSKNFGIIFTISLILELIFIGLIIFGFIDINSKFVKSLKTSQKQNILSAFKDLTNISWHNSRCIITKQEIEASELFAYFDDIKADDAFKGIFCNVPYEIQECTLIQTENMFWKTFSGVIIKFKSNKTIKGKTIITSKTDLNILNRNIGILILGIIFAIFGFFVCKPLFCYIIDQLLIYQNTDTANLLIFAELSLIPFIGIFCLFYAFRKKSKAKNTNLEDVSFEKKFNIKTTDEIECRYLVTTAFMERLKNIQTAFGTQKVKCSFCNGSVTLAIYTNKNIFEIGNLFTPLTDTRHMDSFFNELTSILILIDYFKLDQNIGL